MGWEQIWLGVVIILIGIIIYVNTKAIGPALIISLLGLGLIAFSKSEGTIEKREDMP